jgi:hypothetical protein
MDGYFPDPHIRLEIGDESHYLLVDDAGRDVSGTLDCVSHQLGVDQERDQGALRLVHLDCLWSR